jgi:hypothetical protein
MSRGVLLSKVSMLLAMSIFFILLVTSFALGAPTGATVMPGTSYTTILPNAQAVNIQGGNITAVHVTGGIVTSRWGGFFGNITGEARLGDNFGNNYYVWTVSNPTNAIVYVSTESITNWLFSSFRPAAETDMPAYLRQDTTDNFMRTFTQQEAFDSASLFIPVTPYTTTWQDGLQGTLRTYALYNAVDDAVVWAAKAQADADSFQPGNTVDYQLLVPAQGATTYNFYLELP